MVLLLVPVMCEHPAQTSHCKYASQCARMLGSATLDLGVVNTAPTQPPFVVAVNEPSGKRQTSPRTRSPVEADVVDPEPVMEQIDVIDRMNGTQRLARQSLHFIRVGLKDLLGRKELRTDIEGCVHLKDFVNAMRSAHSYTITIQFVEELAAQHGCLQLKTASDETFIKDKSPDEVPVLPIQPHKLTWRHFSSNAPSNSMISSKPTNAASNTVFTAAQDGHSTATQSFTPRHKPRLGLSVARTAAILYQHTTAVAPRKLCTGPNQIKSCNWRRYPNY